MAEGEESQQGELREAYQKRLQQAQSEMHKKSLLRRMLTEKAYSRMMNVRLSSPELYEKVVASLAYVAQSGRQMERISEEQLYSLLSKMTQKRETSIEFKSK
jgi:DNA-binding TFAR19-related protein (PDSD5 family)